MPGASWLCSACPEEVAGRLCGSGGASSWNEVGVSGISCPAWLGAMSPVDKVDPYPPGSNLKRGMGVLLTYTSLVPRSVSVGQRLKSFYCTPWECGYQTSVLPPTNPCASQIESSVPRLDQSVSWPDKETVSPWPDKGSCLPDSLPPPPPDDHSKHGLTSCCMHLGGARYLHVLHIRHKVPHATSCSVLCAPASQLTSPSHGVAKHRLQALASSEAPSSLRPCWVAFPLFYLECQFGFGPPSEHSQICLDFGWWIVSLGLNFPSV